MQVFRRIKPNFCIAHTQCGSNCYVAPAFSGVPKQRGAKSELAASTMPSRGPKRGRKCYTTPVFRHANVPNQTPMPQRSKQMLNVCPLERARSISPTTKGPVHISHLKGAMPTAWIRAPYQKWPRKIPGALTLPLSPKTQPSQSQSQALSSQTHNHHVSIPEKCVPHEHPFHLSSKAQNPYF